MESEYDETTLLALVGGKVHDMHEYEEQVVQQAERSNVPLLSQFSEGNARLWEIVDSMASDTVLTFSNIRTSLTRVRSELDKVRYVESRRTHILRLKEQLLLAYLIEKLPREDVPVHIVQELAEERQRLYHIQNPIQIQNPLENTVSDVQSEASSRPIKRQKRIPLQEWKRQKSIPADIATDAEIIERRDVLRRKRVERQEKRRKRLEILLAFSQPQKDELQNADEPECQDNYNNNLSIKSDREKFEMVVSRTDLMDASKEAMPETQINSSTSPSTKEKQELVVNCPICFESVNYGEEDQVDVVLSRHMDQCQNMSRRCLRQRTPKSYTESDDISVPMKPSDNRRRGIPRETTTVKNFPEIAQRQFESSLDDLEDSVYEDRVDNWIENGLKNMKVMSERDTTESPPGAVLYHNDLHIPAWVNNRLFPYQRLGLQWMWDLHQQEAGGIVGDEMGLGKTVQVCSFLGCMAACRKIKSVLIVCPATVLRHWLQELAIWAPGLRRILIHKSGESDGNPRIISTRLLKEMQHWLKAARADRLYEPIDELDFEDQDEDTFVGTGYVFVTTYENLRRSQELWTSHRWSYVILDEGQKIRNPDSDITLACKRLRTPHRLLLSGTPIQNDLKELWTLFDFVFPGRLGALPSFETEFAEPIRRGGFSNATPMQVQLAYRCSIILKDLINPFLLRRQKKDIVEISRMPGKTEQVLFCRLSTRQRQLYEAYLKSDEVRNVIRGSHQLFRAVTMLRKISNHPDLVCDADGKAFERFIEKGFDQMHELNETDDEKDDNFGDIDDIETLIERSGKLQVLAKILPLWEKQGHRVLIFCQWTKMLNILQSFIMAQGWKFFRMDGKTSVASRQTLVDNFNQDDTYFAMLMTTRTGGVGLNLTGANRVVIYDPDWNPQTDSQARARSHRFGQTKPVTIYRLITAGTVEEKIYHRQIFKTALTNRVLQDPKQKRLFSQHDLRDFFTLKDDDGSVIQGGQGLTELGAITKGQGVVHPEDIARQGRNDVENEDRIDDVETIHAVLKSKGLAGIFDHDFVDSSDCNKSQIIRDMEEKAKEFADEAVRALRASTNSSVRDRFQPTYTGSTETATSRFGHGGMFSKPKHLNDQNAVAAGMNTRKLSSAPTSKSLLEGLKSLQSSNGLDAKTSNLSIDLLTRIQGYIRRCGGYRIGGGPTTNDILKEFSDVQPKDAAIFRRLLNSIAKIEQGKWMLREA